MQQPNIIVESRSAPLRIIKFNSGVNSLIAKNYNSKNNDAVG